MQEQRWCFRRTLWLFWSKEKQKHKENLVEFRVSSGPQTPEQTILKTPNILFIYTLIMITCTKLLTAQTLG